MYANPGISSWGKIKLATVNTIVAAESFPAFKVLWQPGNTAENSRNCRPLLEQQTQLGARQIMAAALLTKFRKSFRGISLSYPFHTLLLPFFFLHRIQYERTVVFFEF